MTNWHNWDEAAYASNFRRRADWHKKRAKYTCAHCLVRQGAWRVGKSGKPYKVVVSAAHVNHDPRNPRAKLIVLCQSCHKRYDARVHGEKSRRTYHRKQREAQMQAGQLELFTLGKRRK
jgi:hypothetical protein